MSVQIQGFDELIRQLTDAPEHIRDRGMEIVKATTETAAREIQATYPKGPTGNLRDRVKTFYPSESLLVGIIRSTAPHSHLWEFGTRVRRNAAGANRGRMPAHKGHAAKVTPTIADKHRQTMVRQLVAMLRGMGFQISGDVR